MPTMTKLGKYLIRRTLGKGAMGVVYEGFDPVLERTVAIKTILPAQLESSEVENVLARFKREAQAAGRLNHPGIVAVYEYGELEVESDHTMLASPGFPPAANERVAFIAMQFVKGRELRSYFDADERFSLKHVGRIMVEILEALDHAHSNGVTHRDIKPANLILLDDGRVKIADFGIARIESSQLTIAGTVMGTPSYMSPEQFQGQAVDLRSDLFSCGVILYQFLTGEKPFVGTLTSIMFKVLREQPLPPSALNAALNPQWDALMDQAIAKNPDDRFQSASAFATAIRDVLASQAPGKIASPAELPVPVPVPVPVVTPALAPKSVPISALSPASTPAPMSAPALPAATSIDAEATFLTLADVSKALAKIKKEEAQAKLGRVSAVPKASEIRKIPDVPPAHPAAVPRKSGLRLWVAAASLLLAGAVVYLWAGSGKNRVSPAPNSASILVQPSPPLAAPAPAPAPTLQPTVPAAPPPLPVPVLVPVPLPSPSPLPLPVPPAVPERAPAPITEPPSASQTQPEDGEPVKRPVRKPVVVPAAPARLAQPRPEAERPAAERAHQRPSRCALILQKAAVSEPISAEERNFLTSSCQ